LTPKPKALTLDVNYGALRANCYGDVAKPGILALHGWLDNAGSFDYLAPLISKQPLVALDLPGHGLSDHIPEGTRYHFLDFVEIVCDVIEKLNWSKTTIIGHSLGGAIGTVIAATFKNSIDKLVLIDALGPLSESTMDGPARLTASVKRMRELRHDKLRYYKDFATALLVRRKAGKLSAKAATPLVERGSVETCQGVTWRFDPRLLVPSQRYFSEEEVLTYLHAIEAPTCLIRANEGILDEHPLIDYRISAFQHITVHNIPGNHHVHLEEPKAVAKLINGFLDH